VCGRLLFTFLDHLADSQHARQRQLMDDMHAQLFDEETDSPARYLKAWLQRSAIMTFWQEGPTLSPSDIDWILARANSKNSLVSYSKDEMRDMITRAWPVSA
jgi:hypothetical protein